MGEIIQIQLGQCGNRIGNNFWKIISDEHGLNEHGQFIGYSVVKQLERINVFFEETRSNAYTPRAVLVDSDPTGLNSDDGKLLGNAFRLENFVAGHGGTDSNWARGHRAADGLSGRVMDAVRTEAERCDRLQGFQIVHSLGGGTGSGLGARVIDNIRRAMPNRTVNTFSVVPSAAVSDVAVEPYNTALSMARLIGGAHNTYFADNSKLYDACSGSMGMTAPAYADLNHLVSQTMSGVTAGFRFAGELNADMKKCTANLVPYSGLHFFVPGFAPLTFRGQTDHCAYTVPELAKRLLSVAVKRCAVTNRHQRRPVVMAATLIFRGKDLCVTDMQTRLDAADQRWLPDNVKTACYEVPSRGLKISGTVMANTTVVSDMFERVNRRFSCMLAKKSFLNLFTDEGMTVDDFRQAHEQIETLTAEYQSIEENHD